MCTYFISGHLDLSKKEFQAHYMPQLEAVIQNGGKFIVGDARGADSLAQKYLIGQPVIVYHIGSTPRNNYGNFMTQGGFKSDADRDAQMTADSDVDILWIRSAAEQQKRLGAKYDPNYINGTTKNMLRRQK